MKKIFSIVLVVAIALSLIACGDSANESSQAENTTAAETQKQVPAKEFSKAGTITETTLVDEQDFKIIAKSLEYSSTQATLNVYIENNSSSKLSFHSSTLAYSTNMINKVCVSGGHINEELESGTKSNVSMKFDIKDLKMCGIYEIGEISLGIYVTNENSNKDIFNNESLAIKTSSYNNIDYSKDTILEAINNTWESNFGIKIIKRFSDPIQSVEGSKIITALYAEKDSEKYIILEIENTSGALLNLASKNIVINGIIVEDGTWSSESIPADGRTLIDFELDSIVDDEFKNLIDINKIGSFTFTLSNRGDDRKEDYDTAKIQLVIDDSVGSAQSSQEACYNENGIKVTPLAPTEDDYGSRYIIPLQVENTSGKDITVDVKHSSLYINGYAIDEYCFGTDIKNGETGIVSMKFYKNEDVTSSGINSVSDIKQVKATVETKDMNSYKNKNTFEVSFEY